MFTEVVLESVFSTADVKTTTGAGESTYNKGGITVEEVSVLVGMLCSRVCECLCAYIVVAVITSASSVVAHDLLSHDCFWSAGK